MGPLVIVSPAEGSLGTRGSLVPWGSSPNPATHKLCDLSQGTILHLLSSSVKWGASLKLSQSRCEGSASQVSKVPRI